MVGCFLCYAVSCFVPYDEVVCWDFDDVDRLVWGDFLHGFEDTDGEVSVGVVQHIHGVIELLPNL